MRAGGERTADRRRRPARFIMPLGGGDSFGDVHWVRLWLTRQLHIRAHHQPNPLTLDHTLISPRGRSVLAFFVFSLKAERNCSCTGARPPAQERSVSRCIISTSIIQFGMLPCWWPCYCEDERKHSPPRTSLFISLHRFTITNWRFL